MLVRVIRSAYHARRFFLYVVSIFSLLGGTAAFAQEKSASPTGQRPPKSASLKPTAPAAKDPVEEHYQAAETFQLTGDFQKAESEYRHTISLGLQRLAAVRALAQDEQQATEFLRAAVNADASDVDAQMNLAAAYFQSGDLGNAKAILAAIVAKNEARPRVKSLLGKILFMEGDYDGATEQLRSALAAEADMDTAYSLALSYMKLNKVQEATNVFDEMLTSLGSSAELHILIGRAYQDGNQFELATKEFRKALTLNPSAVRAHSYLGSLLLQQRGDEAFAEARGEFLAELVHNPTDYSSHLNLGIIHFKKAEFALAEQEFIKAALARPESAEAELRLGQILYAEGRPVEAVKALRKSILLDGSSRGARSAHEALSTALDKLGEHDEARRESEIAKRVETAQGDSPAKPSVIPSNDLRAAMKPQGSAQLTPRIPPAYIAGLKEAIGNSYHNLGVILAQRSQYPEASALFANAAKWSPGIKALDRNWGAAAFRAQQFKEAIEPLARHVAAQPQDAAALQMLALSYFMTEDNAKAAATFRPVLNDLPDNPGLLYAAGVSLAKSGDAKAAGEIFQRMIARNPDSAEVHLFLAQAYADEKEDEKALDEFAKAIGLNPKLPEANYGAGMIQLRKGNLESAEQYFRTELAVNPGDVSSEYRLGYVLMAQRKPAEAIGLLTDVVKNKPNDADAHYELGKALLENGDFKPAIARLENAVRLKPEEPFAYYQLSLAYRRDGRNDDAESTLRKYERLKQQRNSSASNGKNETNN